jgi:acyl-CoA thioesterase FadM
VTFAGPVTWRPEPYVVGVWVSRVGWVSVEMRCQLTDQDTVLADAATVLVGFDNVTQSSRPFGDDERAQLQELMLP